MKAFQRVALAVLTLFLLGSTIDAATGPGRAALLSARTRQLGTFDTANGELVSKANMSGLVIGEPKIGAARITAEVQLAKESYGPRVVIFPDEIKAYPEPPSPLQVSIGHDQDGNYLVLYSSRFDASQAKMITLHTNYMTFWPAATDAEAQQAVKGLLQRSWKDRWLPVQIDVGPRELRVWFNGRLVQQVDRPGAADGPVMLTLGTGDRLRNLKIAPFQESDRFLPVDLTALGNETLPAPFAQTQVALSGVPFTLAGDRLLSLRAACWPEAKIDPASYYERYDGGPVFIDDERMPFLRIPTADYVAAHILAVAEDDPGLTPRLTLDAGRFDYAGQVAHTFYPGMVPRKSQAGAVPAKDRLTSPAGTFVRVRVPMAQVTAQDLPDFTDVLLTKEMRLAIHVPDPCRYRYRPIGLPSGVKIAAITFERSPLQMKVTSKEAGHAFVEPQAPAFTITLANITARPQRYALAVEGTHLYGGTASGKAAGRVEAGDTIDVTVPLRVARRGYYDLTVTLRGDDGNVLLRRDTSFALLPPDTRRYRASTPFGTWDFCGGHFTTDDPDITGPLYVKAGLRYGMFSYLKDKRDKYAIIPGNEPVVLTNKDANGKVTSSGADNYEASLKRMPDLLPSALLFHEHGISGKHVSRVPDLFTDRSTYKLGDDELKTFTTLFNAAKDGAQEMRQRYPRVKLALGNGTVNMLEELLRQKFPPELFDSAGNESGTFMRMPEAQPPDIVAYNATLWMDRQVLDAYGYKDKAVTQCYEIGYPGSNPGNLSWRTQADYFVRLGLHSLAWNIPYIRIGCITDMGNSYYYSMWGSTGFCARRPEINVKPAFVAVANMTLQLDGAKYQRDLDLGSASLYGMEFSRPGGGYVYPLWTLRGNRPLTLAVDQPAGWKLVDDQGNETPLTVTNAGLAITVTPSPCYLVGPGKVTKAASGQPVYADKPAGKTALLSPLARMDDWTLETDRNAELEFYDMLTPRRKGDFSFTAVDAFEGKTGALQVRSRPITTGKDAMPMYAVLAHKTGIPVPGTPTEVGLWVNGNSGWGRIIFEFVDASGQRWTSIGAQQDGDLSPWLMDWMPKEILEKSQVKGLSDWNTEDSFGWSRINFDGWRYLSFPMPGNFPGEAYHWPWNSQWKWDKDGVVHYPLTFKKLVVELPEKVLHMKSFAPVTRQEIYLKDLSVSQGDTEMLKLDSREHPPASSDRR